MLCANARVQRPLVEEGSDDLHDDETLPDLQTAINQTNAHGKRGMPLRSTSVAGINRSSIQTGTTGRPWSATWTADRQATRFLIGSWPAFAPLQVRLPHLSRFSKAGHHNPQRHRLALSDSCFHVRLSGL